MILAGLITWTIHHSNIDRVKALKKLPMYRDKNIPMQPAHQIDLLQVFITIIPPIVGILIHAFNNRTIVTYISSSIMFAVIMTQNVRTFHAVSALGGDSKSCLRRLYNCRKETQIFVEHEGSLETINIHWIILIAVCVQSLSNFCPSKSYSILNNYVNKQYPDL